MTRLPAHPWAAPSIPGGLIWQDDFNGPTGSEPDPTKWHIEPGAPTAGALQWFTNSSTNIALDGESHLAITARKEPREGKEYTSGRLLTKQYGASPALFAFQYGRIEARIKPPSGAGFWPVFFTLGANEAEGVKWPNNGEIDILEMHGGEPAINKSNVHGGPQEGSWQAQVPVSAPFTGAPNFTEAFHNFGLIWTPQGLEYTVDGFVYARKNRWAAPGGQTWPFTGQQFIAIELSVGGPAGEPTVETPFPSTMLVDWVRVYQ